jgi:REP element-mobilizing transposase RayT
MSEITFKHYPQFFTATILEWKPLLTYDEMKEIIVSSLNFLVKDGRVVIYGFVIMPNHLHIIWQIQDTHERSRVQQSFLKYTAQQMKFSLLNTHNNEIENYKVKASDREYQFWERNSLSIDLWSRPVFLQKLNYIHANPTQPHWKLCKYPEEYKYSTAKFYEKGVDDFGFVTHYLG